VLVAVLGAPAPAFAQDNAAPASSLRGRVVDATTGLPIEGALVRALQVDLSTLTDANGLFAIAGRLPARVTLQIVMLGYALVERQVETGPGTPEFAVALTEAPPTYSEQVEVRADAFPIQHAAAPNEIAIGSADLALLRGILADDPFRAVQAMPGVAAGDDFTAEFSIRGSGPSNIGVLVDGVPAPVVLHTVQGRNDTGSVSMINSDLLDSVVVSGGSYPPMAGNRTGAQVDFATREGSRERPQLRGQVGAAIASVVGEGPLGSGRRGSWLVAGRASYAGWIARRIDPSATTTFTFLDVNSKLTWDVSPSHRASLVVLGGRMFVEERDDDLGINAMEEGLNDSAFALATWRWQASSRLAVTQRASGIYNRFRNLNPGGDELGRGRLAGAGYRVLADWTPRDGLLVDAGASVDATHQEQRLRRFNTRPPLVTTTDDVDATERLVGAFAVVTGTPAPAVTWSAALRTDASRLTGDRSLAPAASVAWNARPAWRVRAGAGQYVQFPSILQLAGRRAGLDLQATRARHADIAIEWRVQPELRWVAGLFQRLEEDGLRLPDGEPRVVNGRVRPASLTSRWENRVETTSRGIELLVQRRRPTGVSGWVSYAYALTRDRDVVADERYYGDYDQRHTLNVYVSWRVSHRLGASLRYRYGSNIPVDGYYARGTDAPDGEPTYVLGAYRNVARYPAYSRFDARVQRSFIRGHRRLTLFVEALNVLNRDNYGPGGPGNAESLFPIIPSAGLAIEF
jgi:hypothetical protein